MSTDYSTEPATVAAVTAARMERGLPDLITELYELARAHERGQQLPPSTPGMAMLLDHLKAKYDADTERHWRAQYASYPTEIPAALGDEADPKLLADEVPGWLLSLPRNEQLPFDDTPPAFYGPAVAHGIAPLPRLGDGE